MKIPDQELNEFPQQEVRFAIHAGITQAEEQKKSNTIHKIPHFKIKNLVRKVGYVVCSVAVIFAILVGSSHYSLALASSLSKLPVIGSIFGDSNLIGLQQAQQHGLTSQIGETQTVNGISVTLDEILYDQNRITISYFIKSQKQLSTHYLGAGMDYTINGELPQTSSGSYSEVTSSSTIRTVLQDINVTEEMPAQFELGLILKGEGGERWYFDTPIQKLKDIYTIPIQHSQSIDHIDLTVTHLAVSPTGVSVSYEASEPTTEWENRRAENIEFRMVDQDGNEIKSHSGGVVGKILPDRSTFKSNKQFDPLQSSVTEVTITPYISLSFEGGGVELGEDGESDAWTFKKGSLPSIEFAPFKVQILSSSTLH